MQKILIVGIVISVLLSALALGTAFCMPHKIVFVDVYKVYNEFDKKKELEKEFEKTKQNEKNVLDSLKIEIEMLRRKYESATGSPAKSLQNDIETNTYKYQNLLKSFENSNMVQSKKYNEQILNELNQDIREYGRQKGYDY